MSRRNADSSDRLSFGDASKFRLGLQTLWAIVKGVGGLLYLCLRPNRVNGLEIERRSELTGGK